MSARVRIAALVLSAAGFVGFLQWEGYEQIARAPVAGDVCTNGFGSTEGVKCGDKTTPTAALVRALRDSEKYQGALKRCVKVELHQHEYDAYVSLAYNIGPTAFCNSTLVKKLNARDYAGACAEISKWDKFQGKSLRGLTNRRAEERALCEGK